MEGEERHHAITAPVVIASVACPECAAPRGVGCQENTGFGFKRWPHRRRYLACKDEYGIPSRAESYSR